MQHSCQRHHDGQDEKRVWRRKIFNPQYPRRAAHFYTGQQHPIQRNENGDLHHDGKAAAHRVDFFVFVNLHHLLLHFLRLVFQALAHFHDFRVDGFHLGHAGVGLGIEPVKGNFQQQHQRHDGPAPVLYKTMQLVEQPVQRFGQNRQPAVVLDQLEARRQLFQHVFFLGPDKQLGVN